MAVQYLSKNDDVGSIFGHASTDLIGFWGTTPCDQAAVTTANLTTITASAHATADYAIAILVAESGYAFTTAQEGASVLGVIGNLQSRIGEIATALEACGVVDGGTAVSVAQTYDYLDDGNDDGHCLGYASTELVGFYGTTPVDQPAALTTALTTITCTAASTADYAVGALVTATGFGFVTLGEAQSFLQVIYNLQIRVLEVEGRLEECGLMAAS